MSIITEAKTFLVTVANDAVDEAKKLFEQVEGIAEAVFVSDTQQLVAKFKDSDFGTRAMNLLEDATAKGVAVVDKVEHILADVIDDVKAFEANGGLPGLVVGLEAFGREAATSLANDFEAAAKKLAA